MKPLKLKLNAFGPYASCEEVDFNKMDSIYLITGPTGAGKTTIFDGISFALFGKTSGKERDMKDLKSDFAEGDMVTYVELEFLLHGETYTIRREPTQIMKGRKTKRNHSVELHLPGGKVITKVNEADEKIESLLGLNIEQFRQIVMLPQGEFKKLIESTTEEKELIFRKIFSSKIYKDFQDNLKDRAILMRRDLEKYRDKRVTLLKKIEPGENAVLSSLINCENINIKEIINEALIQIENDKKEYTSLENTKNEKSKEVEELTKCIENFNQLNIKIDKVVSLKESLNGLLKREEEISLKEKKSQSAKKAREAITYEKGFNESKLLHMKKEEETLLAKETLEKSVEVLNNKKINLQEEEKNQVNIKSLEKKLIGLEGSFERFKEYEEKSLSLIEEEKSLRKIEKDLDSYIKSREERNLKIQEIDSILLEKQSLEVDILTIEGSLKVKNEEIIALREVYRKIDLLNGEKDKHLTLSKEYSLISSNYLKKNAYYEEKSEEAKKEQAGILALSLKEGEPCLVCGSLHHPNKASLSSSMLSEKEIKSLKIEVEKIKEEKEELLKKVSSIKGKVEEMTKAVSHDIKNVLDIDNFTVENIEDIKEKITNKGAILRDELESAKRLLNSKKEELESKNKSKTLREKLLIEAKEIEDKIKDVEIKSKEVFGRCEALKEAKLTLEKSLNGEIKSLKELENEINNTKKCIEVLEENLKKAREEEKEATMNVASFTKNLENKEKELKEAIIHREEKEKEFNNILEKLQFTYESYTESLLEVSEIEEIDNVVKEYRENILTSKQEIRILEEDIGDKEKIDIASIEEKKEVLKEVLKEIEKKEKITYSRNENNYKIISEVESLSRGIGDKEERYSIVSELSNTANGFNSKKITFERYVLAHHFSEILECANIRFKAMTNERYYLERKVDITDGRKGQGLDFDVYDNYTGKTRSIKSLSGGESFKASLALALGLSDVIQMSSGGVRIDAMFIDEGFGTLDPESLEKAIETLLELGGGGKTVGVISHVPELRERIASKIEVGKSKKGSCIKVLEV